MPLARCVKQALYASLPGFIFYARQCKTAAAEHHECDNNLGKYDIRAELRFKMQPLQQITVTHAFYVWPSAAEQVQQWT